MVEFAGIWRTMPKVVYSRTLATPGDNATVVPDGNGVVRLRHERPR